MRHADRLARAGFSFAVACAVFAGTLCAQDPVSGTEEEGPDPAELARQIRRNMIKIEEDLSKAGTHDARRGDQVRKDLDKLLESMKQRQGQVIKDIDDIVKQLKVCGGGGSGSRDSNENQKQSGARDRNESQKQGKPRDPNSGKEQSSKKPRSGQKPKSQKGGGPEDNRPTPPGDTQNQPGDPRGELPPEKVPHVNLNEIWGNLPPELRQKLIDRNFDDFTPEYEAQIQEYFRKTSTPPKPR
jgi:hypothetical protein